MHQQSLRDDRYQIEDARTQRLVPFDENPRAGLIRAQALSKQAPGRILIQPDACRYVGRFAGVEPPERLFLAERPGAAGFSVDDEGHARAVGSVNVPIPVGQAPQERIDNREEPRTIRETRRSDGVAYLLLVMPLLGVFAREIEPVGRLFVPGPGHGVKGRCKGIERLEKGIHLRPCQRKKGKGVVRD